MLARAAQRWNVSAALLAAQLYAESNFNPFAQQPGAARRASRSSCPARPRALGLDDPFDAERRDRRPGAPDARPAAAVRRRSRSRSPPTTPARAPVAGCGCVPPYPETRGYVARILGLLGGAGDSSAGGLEVRLVE